MSPALRAAQDWIKHNTTLLPGFTLQLTIKNSKCSASEAVTDFGKSLISGTKPDLVVGYGCSGAALAALPLASGLRVPTVGMLDGS